MRILYTSGLFLCFVLFCIPQAHARLQDTYRESVRRYEKAGYTMTRTTVLVPPNTPGYPWLSFSPGRQEYVSCATEITWTKKFDYEDPHDVVSIQQVFYDIHKNVRWGSNESKLNDDMDCEYICYRFRDSRNMKREYVYSFIKKVAWDYGWVQDNTGAFIWYYRYIKRQTPGYDNQAIFSQNENMLELFDNEEWGECQKRVWILRQKARNQAGEAEANKDLEKSGL